MTEPRYPERVEGPELSEDELLSALETARYWFATPRPAGPERGGYRPATVRQWPEPPASPKLNELLKLICSADALHVENVGRWLSDEDGRALLCELVKQGSLEFADE